MSPLYLFYVTATALTVAVSFKRPVPRAVAVLLACLWFAGMWRDGGMSDDVRLSMNVWLDGIAGTALIVAYGFFRAPRWVAVTAFLFLGQVISHRLYDGDVGHDRWAYYNLQVRLNVLYVGQLLSVTLGPRWGEIIRVARNLLAVLAPSPRGRVRGGYVSSRAKKDR